MKTVLHALQMLDGFWDGLLHRFTKLWSRVTGKSNFVLARGSLILGISMFVVGALVEAVLHGAILEPAIAPLWMWIAKGRYSFYKEVEDALEASDGTFNMNPRRFIGFAMDRLMYAWLMLLFIPSVLVVRPTSTGIVLYIFSNYFIMHFDCKGGKSVVRVAIEALKKMGVKAAEKARDLVPQPQPIPVPIGV